MREFVEPEPQEEERDSTPYRFAPTPLGPVRPNPGVANHDFPRPAEPAGEDTERR